MFQAEPTIRGGLIAKTGPFGMRRTEFTRRVAAGLHTRCSAPLNAAMKARPGAILLFTFLRHTAPHNPKTVYIGRMTQSATGPVASEIARRLAGALEPTLLEVINDSAQHSGHMGDDGSGESHFTVIIESAAFVGQSRVGQQRLVNQALGDLMDGTVHALAIKARPPQDA